MGDPENHEAHQRDDRLEQDGGLTARAEGNQPDSRSRANPGQHFPALDGLRGVAILLVMLYHFADPYQGLGSAFDRAFLRVLQVGWVGVDLFFVLSGFLITGILCETRKSPDYFRSFYGRRTLRIFPIHYLTLAVLFLVLPRVAHRLPGAFQDLVGRMAPYQVWFWTYSANWLFAFRGNFGFIPGGYFWSLAVEEQFYLVWPLVVFLVKERLPRLIAWLLAACLLLRLLLLVLGASASTVYTITFTHMDGLLGGALIAVAFRTSTARRIADRLAKPALFGGIALLGIGLWSGSFRFWEVRVAATGFSLLALCFSWLLATALVEGTLLHRFLTSRILRSFGAYSYAIYLFHVPVGLAVDRLFFSPARALLPGPLSLSVLAFSAVSTGICWVAGFVSWHLVEKHFLRLKRHFPYRERVDSSPAGS